MTRSAQIARAPSRGDGPAAACAVFINYRREDTSGHALLLADRLGQRFGQDNVHVAARSRRPSSIAARRSERRRRPAGADRTRLGLEPEGPAVRAATPTTPRGARSSGRCATLPDSRDPGADRRGDARPGDASEIPARALPQGVGRSCGTPRLTSDLDGAVRAAATESPMRGRRRRHRAPTGRRRDRRPAPSRPRRRVAGRRGSPGALPRPLRRRDQRDARRQRRAAAWPRHPRRFAARRSTRHAAAEQFETDASGLAEVAQRVAVTLGERRLYTAIKDLVAAQSAAHRRAPLPRGVSRDRFGSLGLRPATS